MSVIIVSNNNEFCQIDAQDMVLYPRTVAWYPMLLISVVKRQNVTHHPVVHALTRIPHVANTVNTLAINHMMDGQETIVLNTADFVAVLVIILIFAETL